MPKKILLIESDATFATRVSDSLEARGVEVRVTSDGKEGLDLARDWAPAAIILCVELPGMSGYLVCQKLKKDERLKAIPLVLTSAEATEETFEKHRTLKARADEYLLKPYEPSALLAHLETLIGLPEAPAEVADPEAEPDEELVSLEEEVGIEVATDQPEPEPEVRGLDLESLPDEPTGPGPRRGDDEDLRLLDDAFESLAGPASPPPRAADAAAALDELTGERPVAADELDAAAATLPDEDEGAARGDLAALGADADAALAGIDETLSPGLSLEARRRPAAERAEERELELEPEHNVRGASADLLRRAGIQLLDDAPSGPVTAPAPFSAPAIIPPPPGAGSARSGDVERLELDLENARAALQRTLGEISVRDADIHELESRIRELDGRIAELGRRAEGAEAELARVRARLDGADGKTREAEGRIREAETKAREADGKIREAETKARDAETKTRDAETKTRDAETKARDAETRAREAETRAREAEAKAREAEADATARREEARRSADEVRRTAEQARVAETALAEIRRKLAEVERRAAAAEEESKRSAAELERTAEELKRKEEAAAAAAEAVARAEALERESEGLRTELVVARGEVDGARGEVEKRTGELRRRIGELEATNSKNEERVVKAYQKIKADEKVRDKVRKALAIASQLLEEGLPAESPADKERRPAAVAPAGRDPA